MEVEILYPNEPPARLYNKILNRNEGLVCFIHADTTCGGLEEAINDTIKKFGFHGSLGVVGAGSVWAHSKIDLVSPTCDSCLIVVDADREERFDEEFDGYHLYVEDYCMQVGGARLIQIDAREGTGQLFYDGRYFVHHSQTLRRRGCAWGDYGKYKLKLNKKWKKIVSTT